MLTLSTRLSHWMLALLCALYLLAGTVGHDPWKIDDAIHLGIAWEFANNGNWLTPRIGVDSLGGIAPLYHWVAAALGESLAWLLPFHDAARLASALFGALMLVGLAMTDTALGSGEQSAWRAPILAIGTLGLLQPIHDAQPAIAVLAAQAFIYAGIAILKKNVAAGTAIAGLALAAGLWSGGLIAAPALLPPFAFALLAKDWRNPKMLAGSAIGLMAGIFIAALWPLLLESQGPEKIQSWMTTELGRFSLFGIDDYQLRDHLELLSWFVWPILPVAIWSIWIKRRSLTDPPILLPLVGSTFAFAEFFLLSDPKPLSSLHLIVPLVLLAVPGAERLRRGASNALDWFGVMTFTFVAGLIWLGGVAIATGEPARVAKNFYKAEPGFVGHLSIGAFIAAGLLTVAWLWVLFGMPRSPLRSLIRWAAGVTLMWGLIATLWLPWIDFGKTYRPVAQSLEKALTQKNECVASKDVGLAQMASLRYFIGLATLPLDEKRQCPLLLIQGASGKEPELKGMKKIWEGNRGGDKSERLRLYRGKPI